MSLLNAPRDILKPPPIRLRCKPGQIARITDLGRNQDRWVHIDCAEAGKPGYWLVTSLQPIFCYSAMIEFGAGMQGSCPDRHLQPINDKPGEDETLTWKPRRQPIVTATTIDVVLT